jgi:ribose transport system ATP-binding protein
MSASHELTGDAGDLLTIGDSGDLLTMSGIGKRYGEPVLSDVQLALRGGEVMALVGANGAGKSTLSKIIGGIVPPTTGRMQLDGSPYAPQSRAQAEACGVRMVLQESALVPTLTVAENLLLGRLPQRAGWISRRRLYEQARAAMQPVGLEAIDPGTLVGKLGLGHRQMIDIARHLIGPCRVLILDEPSAMLSAREVDRLFAQIALLRARGVALVYISHRLDELRHIADRIAVLRDGRLVTVEPVADRARADWVCMMAGREVGECIERSTPVIGPARLKVTGLTRGRAVLDVSLEVGAGEILGISGLVGAGRTELLRLIYGADVADRGSIAVRHADGVLRPAAIGSPRDAVRHGIALLTEDRQGEGLLLTQSIAANVTLGHAAAIAHRGIIDRRRERQIARARIDALGIRTSGPDQAVAELSGGNQQKVVIGRWLERDVQILLFDEPTRGIDIGAKFEIYALLGALAHDGRALIVVSSDLKELTLLCDRIVVMAAGRLVAGWPRGAWSEEALLAAAFSGLDPP